MEKRELLYEGKAKRVYVTSDPQVYWVEYKDDATAFNGEKKGAIQNKGVLNNRISSIFFQYLARNGVPNHFVQLLSEREQLVKKVRIIPVEVVMRNIAAGSMARRLGMTEGTDLPQAILEFYYKDDELGDPLINDDHVYALQLATEEQVRQLKVIAKQTNELLSAFLREKNIILVDFKLEFGVQEDGTLLLADEISPDTCRFWDATTRMKLDKDRFRQDLGQVEEAYQEILERLGGQ
jgi:phosphoribosylaminoimidazole-succinocarboxamide synthase